MWVSPLSTASFQLNVIPSSFELLKFVIKNSSWCWLLLNYPTIFCRLQKVLVERKCWIILETFSLKIYIVKCPVHSCFFWHEIISALKGCTRTKSSCKLKVFFCTLFHNKVIFSFLSLFKTSWVQLRMKIKF